MAHRGSGGSATAPAGATEHTAEAALHRRPALRAAYVAALPGARAAVLSRLWGALTREPIPGLAPVAHDGADLVVRLADGRRLRGPGVAARPFAAVPDGFTLTVDGAPFDHPATLLAALGLPGHAERLRAELDDSVANLALARAAQPPPDGGPPLLDRLSRLDPAAAVAYAEQLVVDGHPLHPCCRTRIGLSTAEILAYAPEHHPIVALAVVDVPADDWLATGTGAPPRLLVHPWQVAHVLDRYPRLRPTAETVPARPLMSLRTLAPVAGPDWHVKTAVDVQMTSAVRTVSAAAVHNGPALSALLADLARDLPGFEVLAEVAGGAVVADGAPVRSLAMLLRRAPRVNGGEIVVPLAALAARSPADGRALVCEAVAAGYGGDPTGFFTDLVHLLFTPLTTLLHRGVALEAHGQNMCVVLRRGRPVRLLYRDLGGVRISPRRLAAHGYAAPPLRGDLESDDPAVLRTKLAAALLSTVVAQQVAVLAGAYGTEPAALWRIADRALADAYAGLPDSAGADARALRSGPWPVKATTAMRLADDPLDDRWTWHDNPFEAR